MNIYLAAVVIFVTSLAVFWWAGTLPAREERRRYTLERLADPRPLPHELPRAGRFDVTWQPGPPFAGASQTGQPPDTGPLLIVSEAMAANDQLEREVRAMVREAEAKIPRRWR